MLMCVTIQDLDDRPDRPVTDPSEPRVFENVISGLQKSYPQEKMDEISTSFCFICLLHLANEQGLKLEPPPAPGAEEEAQAPKKVGNLWDIKVSFSSSVALSGRGGVECSRMS